MKAPIDVRAHIRNLEARGLLVRVKRPTDKDTEIHPIVRWQFRAASVKRTARHFFSRT
jgi:3-polyprenyl-4-hydroxybenzoate decarboxylase